MVQHAGAGGAVSGASSGCTLSNEELTVTCLAPLPLELQLISIDQRHNHSHLTRFGQGASSYYTAFKSGSNPSTTSMATYMKVILLGEGISPLCSAPMLGVQHFGHSFLPSLEQVPPSIVYLEIHMKGQRYKMIQVLIIMQVMG